MIDPLPGAYLRQNLELLRTAVVRNDDLDRFADGFIRGELEYPFGSGIPRQNDAVQILADDCIVGGPNDCGKVRLGFQRRCVANRVGFRA